jgi:transcription initiation factor TFIIIB Brf1 subunit/transcription initiation factor TFIIB
MNTLSYITKDIICIECKSSKHFIQDDSEASLVCTNCGIVAKDRMIDDSPDWMNYEAGDHNARCSTKDDSNPYSTGGTYIPRGSFVVVGHNPNGTPIRMDLFKIHTRVTYSSKQRSFDTAVSEFKRLEDHGISASVIGRSKKYWEVIMKKEKIHRGGVRKGILASCILYACYEYKCSLTKGEVADLMDISLEDINKGEYIFSDLIRGTKLEKVLKLSSDITQMFERNISSFGLSLDYKYGGMCLNLYTKYGDRLVNMGTKSIVAGIICYVLKIQEKLKKPSKGRISEILNVSNPTINKLIAMLKEFINEESKEITESLNYIPNKTKKKIIPKIIVN